MNGYGLWDQWYGLTPAEQAAQKAHQQANPNYLSNVPTTGTNIGTNIGTNTGTNIGTNTGANTSSSSGMGKWEAEAQKQKKLRESYIGPTYDFTTEDTTDSNPFSIFGDRTAQTLAGDDQKAYYSSGTGERFAAGSPAQRRFFQTKFDDIYAGFLEKQGKQIREAQGQVIEDPLFFADYLKTDPFSKMYDKLIPSERGESTARYSPRARHIYF